MKTLLFAFSFFVLAGTSVAQENCGQLLIPDTLTLPGTGKVLSGESAETTFKNLSSVKLFKSGDGKIYLRMVVTENFYFNKTDVLEIKSGTKSYYAKNTTQHKISKSRGLFVIEIYKNYVYTLRDGGITGIAFGGAETDFTKQDEVQVKKIAACLYDKLPAK